MSWDKKLRSEWTGRNVPKLATEFNVSKTTVRNQLIRLGLVGPRDPDRFACGHPRTPENTYSSETTNARCLKCKRQASNKAAREHRRREKGLGGPILAAGCERAAAETQAQARGRI
jgi:hypothetical protein